MSERRPPVNGSRWRRWHRTLGIVSALFVLLLSVTGLMLNHSHDLGLDRRHADAGWLEDWYGIGPAGEPVSFRAGGEWVSWLDGVLYTGAHQVDESVARPVGAVSLGRVIAVGLPGGVLLLTPDGRRVDRLGAAAGVPGGVARIGRGADGRLLVSANGRVYEADEALTRFEPWPGAGQATWSSPGTAPASLRQSVRSRWRGNGMSLERVLLDFHSGRFWGPWGVWLMDAMALIFLILSLTGAWLWWRRRNGSRLRLPPS